MIVSQKNKHFHIHVPKNGGTSFREMMLSNGWEGYSHHMTVKDVDRNQYQFQDFYKTIMIRNPWEHAVSYYRYLLHETCFNIRDFSDTCETKETYKNINPEDVTFENYIKTSYQKRHYQSLTSVELEEKGLTFDKWFDYSDFDDMLNFMEGKFKIELNRDLRIHDKNKFNYVIDIDVSKPYQEFYNDETFEIVKNVSKKEIEIFNYKF